MSQSGADHRHAVLQGKTGFSLCQIGLDQPRLFKIRDQLSISTSLRDMFLFFVQFVLELN